jgi:large conductance mechanosensitive channel
MGMVSEFREFIQRGNVVDMAVGVIMGAAFGRIVSALVDGVLMPPIGVATGGVNFSDLRLPIGGTDAAPVTLNYGAFLQTVIDFLIIAFCVFLLVKAVNRLRTPATAAAAPAEPPEDVKLLTEIRDLLRRSAAG